MDESTLTGEALPVSRPRGTTVSSGTVNAGEAFDLRAIRTAAESAYAGIVRAGAGGRAPARAVRPHGRPLRGRPAAGHAGRRRRGLGAERRCGAGAGGAGRGHSLPTDPGGADRADLGRLARRKAGGDRQGRGTIEALGRARTVLFDKTGTLTRGRPDIEAVRSADGLSPELLLRLAASVDQLSAHVLAEALVHGAEARRIELAFPEDVVEDPGQGIEGTVDGHRVAVGSGDWLAAAATRGSTASRR